MAKFKKTGSSDFRLVADSPAIDDSDMDFALTVPLIILGADRTDAPDIGAYEFTTEE